MPFDDLIRVARLAVQLGGDPAELGLHRLAGGMSHDVFSPVDDPSVVAKVFSQATAADAAAREWTALVALAGARAGLAPGPLEFDGGTDGGDPVVVMAKVAGEAVTGDELRMQHVEAIGAAHRSVHGVVGGAAPRGVLHDGLLRA